MIHAFLFASVIMREGSLDPETGMSLNFQIAVLSSWDRREPKSKRHLGP